MEKNKEQEVSSKKTIEFNFNNASIVQAIVNAEILGPPRGRKKRNCRKMYRSVNR
jgi:hypothetical protein